MTTVSAGYVFNFAVQANENPWVEAGYTEKSTATQIVSGTYRRTTGSPLTIYTGGTITGGTARGHIEVMAGGAASDKARIVIVDTSGNGYIFEIDATQGYVAVNQCDAWVTGGGLATGNFTPAFVSGDRFDFQVVKGTPNVWTARKNGNPITLSASSQTRTLGDLQCGFGIRYLNNGNVQIGSFGIDGLPAGGGGPELPIDGEPPPGYAFFVADVPWDPAAKSIFQSCTPAVADGDQVEVPLKTTQGADLTVRTDGTFVIAASTGPQTFSARVYDLTTSDWSASYTVTVTTGVPEIITTTLDPMTHGAVFSQTLAVVGNTPITWGVTAGALPAGLTLATTTGNIFGTPSAPGAYSFSVTATNASGSDVQAYSGSVLAVAPTITTPSMPDGRVGVAYSLQLAATGSTPITWLLASGALPAGVTVNGSGLVAGTPTASGSFSPRFRATNSSGNNEKTLAFTVLPVAETAPDILTTALNTLTHGVAFSQSLSVTGSSPITWSVTAGTLPAGITLATGTGTLSGTPTTPGAYSFSLTATNVAGSDVQAYSGSVLAVAPTITTVSMPDGRQGDAYSLQLAASGSPTITWALASGTLPTGVTVNGSGLVSGTPTVLGSFSPRFSATNTAGSNEKTLALTIQSAPAVPPDIATIALATMTHGVAFSQTLSVSGNAPITWALASGTLPAGITLATATGTLSGTPTAPGAYSFSLTATNSAGSDTQAYAGNVLAVAPVITTSSLPDGRVGTPYSAQLSASGSPTITWSRSSGALPAGVVVSASGLISGTPTATGSFSPGFTATNVAGSNSKTLALTIQTAVSPPFVAPGNALSGIPISPSGAWYVGTGSVSHYHGGYPINATHAMVCNEPDAITHWSCGMPRTAGGAIAIDSAAPVVRWHNGLPLTAGGRIATEVGAVARWSAGVPLTSAGRVAVAGQ